MEVRRYDEVTSTNDTLLALATGGAPSGTVVVAERQTAGRGRLGRAWLSLPGEHVLMSVLWRPPEELARALLPGITLAAGVAIAEALAAHGVDARLKWPNDVRVGGKKVGGVLSELHEDLDTRRPFVIVGVGLDVNARASDLPPELAALATTLMEVTGAPLDRAALVDALARRLVEACVSFGAHGGLGPPGLAAYRAMSETLGRRVRVDGRPGVADGVDDDGALRVTFDDGAAERVVAGDVEILTA